MSRPVRVLHVVGHMHRGGVETWLMQVLRMCDPARLRMDFLVTRPEPGDYDDEIRSLGGRIVPCLSPRRPVTFARNFRRAVGEYGPYDVLHSHVHHYSGFALALARLSGIPVRIAHSHLDTAVEDASSSFARKMYLRAMGFSIRRFATLGLAASGVAAGALFGSGWERDPRWRIMRCALDFSAFLPSLDASGVRAELGIPTDALLIGHVGRFDPQKNHEFLLEVAAEVCSREPRARFILVGDGPLRPSIEARAAAVGLATKIRFLGVRRDVPRLLRSCDALLFPSKHEGLPLVCLEAQAAALPIVLSTSVTREVMVVNELFEWRSLSSPPAEWAQAVLSSAPRRPKSNEVALEAMGSSPFSLTTSFRAIEALYGA